MLPAAGWVGVALVAIAALGSRSTAAAQQTTPQPAAPQTTAPKAPALHVGPTVLNARGSTARSMAGPVDEETASLARYLVFEEDFARDFGVELALALGDEQFATDFLRRFTARWSDSDVYQWVERGIVMYAQFEAATRFERKGFDMGVDVDDVTQGKLGVRVSRSLE